MTALAAEVIWTRLLSLLFGATVYTFSLILAVFLFGLGIGSSIGSAIGARHRAAARRARLVPDAARAARSRGRRTCCTQSLPYWPINPSISTDPWFNFQLDLVRCLWAVLPGAILWGASFPLALASVATRRPGSRRGWSAASTPRTRSARSSARSTASLLLVVVARQPARRSRC